MAQNGGLKRAEHVRSARVFSDINLFRYCQRVIDLNAKIPDRAFDLGMPEQELDGPEITCPSIDQGRFCSSQGMRAEQPRVQPDASDPPRDKTCILAGGHTATRTTTPSEQELAGPFAGSPEIVIDRLTGLLA